MSQVGAKIRVQSEMANRVRRALCGLVAAMMCAATGAGTRGQTSAQGRVPTGYAIIGVSVVDVEKGLAAADQTVVLTGERIALVGPRARVAPPAGHTLIDGRGLFLIPGLVDAHVHYFDPPVFGRALLANGVVLVREMGQANDTVLPLRQALNSGAMLGPEMVATGWILDGAPPFIPQTSRAVNTVEEARAAVRQQAAAGVDEIKVYSRLEKNLFLAIADEAKRAGLKVVGHVPEAVYIEEAAGAGLASLEHVHIGFGKLLGKLLGAPISLKPGGMADNIEYFFRLGEVDSARLHEALGRLRATGTVVCPTVIVLKAQAGDCASAAFPRREYISPTVQAIWSAFWRSDQRTFFEKVWQPAATFVRTLHDAGVPLLVGTDLVTPGVIPGFSVHDEMALWQDAGIPAADILRSATLVPARFMGKEDRVGSIAAGKFASVVLVRGNPLEDIHNASHVQGVFLRGHYFDRTELDRMLGEARAAAAGRQ